MFRDVQRLRDERNGLDAFYRVYDSSFLPDGYEHAARRPPASVGDAFQLPATPPSGNRQRSITCEFRRGAFRPLRSDGPWIAWNCPENVSEDDELQQDLDDALHLPLDENVAEADELQQDHDDELLLQLDGLESEWDVSIDDAATAYESPLEIERDFNSNSSRAFSTESKQMQPSTMNQEQSLHGEGHDLEAFYRFFDNSFLPDGYEAMDEPRPSANEAETLQLLNHRASLPPGMRQRTITCELLPGLYRPLGSDGPWIAWNCPDSVSEADELQQDLDDALHLPLDENVADAAELQQDDDDELLLPLDGLDSVWGVSIENAATEYESPLEAEGDFISDSSKA